MQYNETAAVECYVVFTGSNLKNPVMRFLDEKIKHVYVIQRSPGDQFWIVINPIASHTQVELLTVDNFPHPRTITGDDAVIVPVKSYISLKKQRFTLCVFNCVEVVKSLIGVRNFWIFTPYQLYKYLMRGV